MYIKNDFKLILGDGLAQVLGFKDTNFTFLGPVLSPVSDYEADTDRGFYSLYVYCVLYLCEPQFVGDAYVPLLRIVDAKGKDKQIIAKTYNLPEINLKTDTGQDVSFVTGKVICKLHFRIKR